MNKNPLPTVDIIIEIGERIVLIERKNPPGGWALPGGFVDYQETVEKAAAREAKEETALDLTGLEQFRVYSSPQRDPRQHTISTVFIARGEGELKAGDDAGRAALFDPNELPEPIAFDHRQIIGDYLRTRKRKGLLPLEERKTSIQGQLLREAGAFSKYRDIFVGRRSLFSLARYEAITLLFSSLGGALGFWLRKVFFKRLLKKVGRGVVFGRHITIRHPHKIEIGDRVFIDDFAVLDAKGENNQGIRIGCNCFIGRNSVLSCKEGDIEIDDYTAISSNCSLLSESRIHIGSYTHIAGHCYLVAGGNHGYERRDIPMMLQDAESKGGIVLEGDNWLGAGVQVLDGCRIGRGSIIAAGSTVHKSIESYSIAVGIPALVTKRRR